MADEPQNRVPVTMRFDPDLLKRVDAFAESLPRVTRTEVFHRAVEEYLKANEPKPKKPAK